MEKGTIVNYGSVGLCTITDRRFDGVMGASMEFYVLAPLSDPGTTYCVPVENTVLVNRMRPLLSPDEANALIKDFPCHQHCEWIDDERSRKARFTDILNEGTHDDLVSMIGCLQERKAVLSGAGKKLRTNDNNFYVRAKTKLFSELAYVLGIDKRDAENMCGLNL